MEFQAGDIQWKATRFGTGKTWLIALHGYGQQASLFHHLAEICKDKYSILAIDLAYHGNNDSFQKGFLFDKNYAQVWLDSILEKTGQKQIGLVGYSIGGRISLSLTSWFPELISELILLAPDGVPVSTLYRLLTNNAIGNALFRTFIHSPGFAFGFIKLGVWLKIIPTKVSDFYRNEISTLQKRQQLYDAWMAYRLAIPQYDIIKKYLKKGKISVVCILGRNDKVIPYTKTRKAALKFLPGIQIIELEAGHNLLSDKATKLLAPYWRA